MRYALIALLITLSQGIFAQQDIDSLKTEQIEEVVITAQYNKQSVKKSVFDVTVINQQTIAQNAANNLADLLNQNLNLSIVPNTKAGKSKISLFGLDGQYFKILRDGVPVVSEDGLGNNIDLTQINLDNVAQIEIVEGSMGVQYGANAVSGIINIISKNKTPYRWETNASIQEESVGDEYEWWAKGRHIQKIGISHSPNKHWFFNFNVDRNHFTGFLNNKKGENYSYSDGLRGYEWLPKEQLNSKFNTRYKADNISISYKLGVFKELLNQYNQTVITSYNANSNSYEKKADDTDYLSHRIAQDILINGKTKQQANYTFQIAHQKQIKKLRKSVYDLYERTRDLDPYQEYLSRNTFFAKSTINNLIQNKVYNYEIGLEYNYQDGFGSALASIINTRDIAKKLSNIDGFVSAEYRPNSKLFFRPGLRYSIQDSFKNQFIYALSTRYLVKNNFELRTIIGSSFRTPNFDELYTYFVDANHNVQGNENLIPETSFSFFTHLKKTTYFDNAKLTNKLKIGYINVNDKIDLAIASTAPFLSYKYFNINQSKSIILSLDNNYSKNNFNMQLGFSLIGLKESLNTQLQSDFNYNLIINSTLSYKIAKANTTIALSYKYNGKQYNYFEDSDGDYVKNTLASYNWSDLTVKKAFFNNKIEATVGARNLFDVTNITSSLEAQTSTHSQDTNINMGYGHSYFIKLQYNLNIK